MSKRKMEEATTETGDVEAELGERPASDRLAMERVRAKTELALFGHADPARVGRYVVLEPIASGGMGMVFSAYDPKLDRRVAMKVVHSGRVQGADASERLLREARALAKLDHPNVVKVHDVLTVDEQLVIIMELVEGVTLAAWESANSRTVHEVLEVYLGAAQGLAAAHGVDVVHRDFKPGNVVVGGDGRVRVLDFGLAWFTGAESIVDLRGETTLGDRLTETGSFVGTLGYSSPEQLRGQRVDAASDQFSFCVALHRALEGVAPYDGESIQTLLDCMARGAPRTGPRRVPGWLRRVVAIGLAEHPADRYASMAPLIAELRRPRGWRRWRPATYIGGALAMGAGLAIGLWPAAEVDACGAGRDQLAGVWSRSVRAGLVRRTDSESGVPGDVAAAVLGGLDRYVGAWGEQSSRACTTHRKGGTSDTLYDKQRLCLDRRLSDLRAALHALERVPRETPWRLANVVADMPGLEHCADLPSLEADAPPPPDPSTRQAVEDVRRVLSDVAAHASAGDMTAAVELAVDATARAERTGYRPVVVEAVLAEAKVRISLPDAAIVAQQLQRARDIAFREGMLPVAIEAAARLIYVINRSTPDAVRVEHELALLDPISGSLTDNFARPLLLNNAGTAFTAAGRRDRAFACFQAAKAAIRPDVRPAIELTTVDRNLAGLTADDGTRERLLSDAVAQLRDAYGENHPITLDARSDLARFTADAAVAYERTDELVRAYEAHQPDRRVEIARASYRRAELARVLGHDTKAVEAYRHTVEATRFKASVPVTDHSSAGDVATLHHLAAGQLAVLEGDLDAAEASFVVVREGRLQSKYWWERETGYQAELALGDIAERRGRVADAIEHLQRASAGYAEIVPLYEVVSFRRNRDAAQKALVRLGAVR